MHRTTTQSSLFTLVSKVLKFQLVLCFVCFIRIIHLLFHYDQASDRLGLILFCRFSFWTLC